MPDITLLSTTRRQGRIGSASDEVPADAPTTMTVELPIAAGDKSDPGNVLHVTVYISDDGGLNWRAVTGITWRGSATPIVSPSGEVNPNPRVSIDAIEFRGKRVRVDLDAIRALRCGCVLRR